jgi:hypothetical protein
LKKKILGLVIILFLKLPFLYSFDIETASKIFDKLFFALLQKKEIFVFTNNEDYKKVITNSEYLKIANTIDECDIILATQKDDLKSFSKKIIFTTEKEFLDYHENVVGAFYWNKGKPEIIFLKEKLEKNNLKLIESFERYIK